MQGYQDSASQRRETRAPEAQHAARQWELGCTAEVFEEVDEHVLDSGDHCSRVGTGKQVEAYSKTLGGRVRSYCGEPSERAPRYERHQPAPMLHDGYDLVLRLQRRTRVVDCSLLRHLSHRALHEHLREQCSTSQPYQADR